MIHVGGGKTTSIVIYDEENFDDNLDWNKS